MAARWYVLHVYSGFESKVAQAIREKVEQFEMSQNIEEVLVPIEEVVKMLIEDHGFSEENARSACPEMRERASEPIALDPVTLGSSTRPDDCGMWLPFAGWKKVPLSPY